MMRESLWTGRRRSGGRSAVQCLVILSVLVWSGMCTAKIPNHSFEDAYYLAGHGVVPAAWRRWRHPSFNSSCSPAWSTDGTLSGYLLSRRTTLVNFYPFTPGNYQSFFQTVDLTGIDSIVFDARLAASPDGPFEHFKASCLVDGVPLWTGTAGGVFKDQRVKVSHLGGWRRIELRLTAVDGGTFDKMYLAHWDNLRLMEGDETIPATVDLDPDTLNLNSRGRWVTCYIALPEDYDVNDIDGATVQVRGPNPESDGVRAYLEEGEQGWATPEGNEANVLDRTGDGTLERMVKFSGAALRAIVTPGENVKLTVSGSLRNEGPAFEGTATVRVIDRGGHGNREPVPVDTEGGRGKGGKK